MKRLLPNIYRAQRLNRKQRRYRASASVLRLKHKHSFAKLHKITENKTRTKQESGAAVKRRRLPSGSAATPRSAALCFSVVFWVG